jgi:hypothetical protein
MPDIPTPFDQHGAVDLATVAKLCERQINAGVSAIVVSETCGEASTLTSAEQESIIRTAVEVAVGRDAVTLDNADRLAVIRIAQEIDRLDRRYDGGADFEFFCRTSLELCAAILHPGEGGSAVLQQYLARIEDDRLKRAIAATIDACRPTVSRAKKPIGRGNDLWKGLASRSNH